MNCEYQYMERGYSRPLCRLIVGCWWCDNLCKFDMCPKKRGLSRRYVK